MMGFGIAHALLSSGHLVTVWNRTRLRAEPLEAEGAELAASAAEAVQEASVVITMLPDAESTARVMADALTKFRPGAVWVQMGTVGMSGIQDLAAMAAAAGVAFVDAPVSGSREPAQAGELLILASGPASIRAEVQPVFDAVGRATIWAGEGAGPATALKLVVNDWLINLLGCLGEALALAGTLGVDPKRFLEAISGGPLDAPIAQTKGVLMVDQDFPPSFPLHLAEKDAELVLQAAQEHGVDLPITVAATALLARARSLGHGEEDVAAIYAAMAPARGTSFANFGTS